MNVPEPVNLTNCDREPIHIPGSIQPHGAMLVMDPSGQKLLFASANIPCITGYGGDLIPGTAISLIVGEKNAHDFRNAAAKAREPGLSSVILGLRFPGKSLLYDAVVHTHLERTFVEIEPCADRGQSAREALDLTRSLIHRIGREETVERVAKTGVRLVRAMLGYDRVMIYQFLHNGAGRVIAEAKSPTLGSFMGQHFPASDIPLQARHLYLVNTIRMISDTSYQSIALCPSLESDEPAIDMSFAQLRSVSPIHCQYLQNMGVSASLSISIVVDDELWGLIACHHDSPKVAPLPLRIGAELFGQYFSLHIADCERRTTLQVTADARTKLDAIVSQLSISDEIRDSLGKQLSRLSELVAGNGAALWMNGQWLQSGDTLDEHQTRQLLKVAGRDSPRELWASQEIRGHLTDYTGSVAGMLAIPLSMAFSDYLVLFRNEEAHAIEWAGEPVKTTAETPFGARLTPRGSFDTWREEVRGRSTPWTASDLSVAQSIGTYLRDVILRQNELSEQERAKTEQRRRVLNAELNHRVKNILSLVKSIALQTGANAANIADYAQTLEGRLRALASAHDQSLDGKDGGSLAGLLETEVNLYSDTPGRITLEGPPVHLDQRAFSVIAMVFHEMMTNAAKYGALSVPEGRLKIRWKLEASGDCEMFWNETNGPSVTWPSRTGFGSKLIKNSLEYDLRGKTRIEYHRDGLQAQFSVPSVYVTQSYDGLITPDIQIEAVGKTHIDGMKILVVEDQSLIALDMENTLRKLGAEHINLASNAPEALEMIEISKPNLAILDFNLGDNTSENIAELLLKLKIPFLFTTGYSDRTLIPEKLRDITIVRKPISDSAIAAAINSVLG
ncbi:MULTISPECIES: HWE histidine kinase domain-containing protein [unclassified Ochrobactrum]|uniref:HWE histidine kinase domain-containing protein n=1 Tax=unclassified Ochrobactrum TaxID=239106 RepID=UPI0015FD2599|nr:light-regulated signal transduction histidine kinase (bacteriophytochrome)/CheY-like chemotaxis protein [Ochrobactrum sp. RH2CCR150]MDH7785823.1 light-regulated signal transduction histidine kinase (bacteriophytochrome)/CheY-like chemotaxis protein [Ochrobactrum sp. 19YEA23]